MFFHDRYFILFQVSFETQSKVDINNLSGRLLNSLVLHKREQPYLIRSDLTVMPEVTLTIQPGAIIEFGPRVGLLVLGTLLAKGRRDDKIIMRPISQQPRNVANLKKPLTSKQYEKF